MNSSSCAAQTGGPWVLAVAQPELVGEFLCFRTSNLLHKPGERAMWEQRPGLEGCCPALKSTNGCWERLE